MYMKYMFVCVYIYIYIYIHTKKNYSVQKTYKYDEKAYRKKTKSTVCKDLCTVYWNYFMPDPPKDTDSSINIQLLPPKASLISVQ